MSVPTEHPIHDFEFHRRAICPRGLFLATALMRSPLRLGNLRQRLLFLGLVVMAFFPPLNL